MRNSYILKLAFRNIRTRKLRSLLTISGVAIGVGFIIFLISLGYGLKELSTNEIANIDALETVDITPGKSKIIKINDTTIEKFKKMANVVSVEPKVDVVGKLSLGTSSIEGAIYGKNIELIDMEELQLVQGNVYKSNFAKEALVNETALKQLGITDPATAIGRKISLDTTISTDLLAEGATDAKKVNFNYTVGGIIKNESSAYVYIPLEALRGEGVKYYTAAKMRVTNKLVVDAVSKELESQGFMAKSLKNTVDQINEFFTVFQLILLSFGLIAIIVAAIGMFNTLTISLLEKTREISFMKVLGTVNKDVWRLFLAEALIIGTAGGVVGIGSGVLIGNTLNAVLIKLAQETGNQPVEIFYTPGIFVVIVFLIALGVSFLTGVYPSFRATRIDPLEALRYE